MNEDKFNGLGKVYSKFRPNYPESFVNYLYDELRLESNSVIADIGSGTGKLTKQLLKKGGRVFAVEPNRDMRCEAERDLSCFKNFTSVNGTAEATTLQNKTIDLITVAQAFHWFDLSLFKQECKRLLSNKGKIALVWNSRDDNYDSVKECDLINKKYCPSFNGFSGGIKNKQNSDVFDNFFEGGFECRTFDNSFYLNEDTFIGRQLSSSYALKETDKNFNSYIEELKAVFQKYSVNGEIISSYITESYVGVV